MDAALGLLGAGIITLSACYYLLDIVCGQTRPQRTSWGVWAAVGLLGFGTAEAGGAGPGAWSSAIDAVACIVTFTLSLHPRFGKRGGRRLDPLLGAIALAGVVLWRWGPLGVSAAAACAVACNVLALWPTMRGAWRQPRTESLPSWSADLVGHLACLAAVSNLSFAALAFPLYMVFQTASITVILILRRHRACPTPAREQSGRNAESPERPQDRTADVRRFGPVGWSGDTRSRGPGGYGKAGTVSGSDLFSDGGAT